ncbi:MAG: hypothetical protein JSU65_08640, partial [Candidatus Zixiibacteriota bacterium]
MTTSLGRIYTQLAQNLMSVPPKLINLINENVGPPHKVAGEDVHVRAMYVVSDQVNSYGGCFPTDEHERLVRLLIDTPVLVGHRKDKLPVGRTFHAEEMERNGENWVKSYFYWLKSAQGADNLAENIDGGIYKECSVAFTYRLPECSICGKDIRVCEHEPRQEYRIAGQTARCHYNYRQLERVLETSLVYRGAVKDTAITRDLGTRGKIIGEIRGEVRADGFSLLSDPTQLSSDVGYLVVPHYDGILVRIEPQDGDPALQRPDGSEIDCDQVQALRQALPCLPHTMTAMLIGYRGRERCRVTQLEKFLQGESSPVKRLALRIYPDGSGIAEALRTRTTGAGADIGIIPYRVVEKKLVKKAALEIKTRDGVEIYAAGGVYNEHEGYLYQPYEEAAIDRMSDKVVFTISSEGEGHLWMPQNRSSRACLEIHRFNDERFKQ